MMSTRPTNPPQHIAHALLSRAHSPQTANAIFHEKVLQKPLFLLPTNNLSTTPIPLITPSAGPSATATTTINASTTINAPHAPNARTTRRLARLHRKAHYLSHRKPRPLSAKEKRRLGVYDVPKEARKYAVYEGLHRLWVGYMWEVLGLQSQSAEGDGGAAPSDVGGGTGTGTGGRGAYVTAQSSGSRLASADFHGAEVEVVRSRCVGRVGVKGIVVRDTKFTFEVVTRRDVVKVIPKEHTIFRFEIPQPPGTGVVGDGTGRVEGEAGGLRNLAFELHGSQFENRAPERATKKFKQRNMSDL